MAALPFFVKASENLDSKEMQDDYISSLWSFSYETTKKNEKKVKELITLYKRICAEESMKQQYEKFAKMLEKRDYLKNQIKSVLQNKSEAVNKIQNNKIEDKTYNSNIDTNKTLLTDPSKKCENLIDVEKKKKLENLLNEYIFLNTEINSLIDKYLNKFPENYLEQTFKKIKGLSNYLTEKYRKNKTNINKNKDIDNIYEKVEKYLECIKNEKNLSRDYKTEFESKSYKIENVIESGEIYDNHTIRRFGGGQYIESGLCKNEDKELYNKILKQYYEDLYHSVSCFIDHEEEKEKNKEELLKSGYSCDFSLNTSKQTKNNRKVEDLITLYKRIWAEMMLDGVDESFKNMLKNKRKVILELKEAFKKVAHCKEKKVKMEKILSKYREVNSRINKDIDDYLKSIPENEEEEKFGKIKTLVSCYFLNKSDKNKANHSEKNIIQDIIGYLLDICTDQEFCEKYIKQYEYFDRFIYRTISVGYIDYNPADYDKKGNAPYCPADKCRAYEGDKPYDEILETNYVKAVTSVHFFQNAEENIERVKVNLKSIMKKYADMQEY